MTTAVPSERRERYLAPYLDDLERFVRTSRSSERPAAVRIGSRSLPVEAWEWDALVEWCGSGRAGWQTLLASGLSLEARCLADFESALPEAPGSARTAGSKDSDLQFDAILGFKLMLGLQKSVERMVIQGRMDQAKKLTQFRHRVNESVSSLGARIGEEALREAEVLGVASKDHSEGEADLDPRPARNKGAEVQALLDLEEKLEKIATQAAPPETTPRPQEEAAVRPWSPRLLLAAVLAVLCTVWFFVVAWPAATHQRVPGFTLADFAKIEAIQDVVARPPSLFVLVDDLKWRTLSEDERRRVVEAVEAAIEPAGYTGARFAAPNGATVGQWLKTGGVHVNDLTKPPS